MRLSIRPVLALVALAALAAGCQSEVRSPLGERAVVKGKVTVAGRPLTKGTVVFAPVDPAKGDPQVGYLNPSGEYVTSVFPGKYKVALADTRAVPSKYLAVETTDLEFDIPRSGKSDADLNLK
jgi:hypothetical protein